MYDARTSLHRGNDPRPIARPGRADQGPLPAGTKVGLIVVGALIALSIAVAAFAQPPAGTDPGSPTSQWYRSLKQPGNGVSCCDRADCREYSSRTSGAHWQVLLDNKWVDVPDSVVLRRDNPTGRAVACILGSAADPLFLCFVPPSMV